MHEIAKIEALVNAPVNDFEEFCFHLGEINKLSLSAAAKTILRNLFIVAYQPYEVSLDGIAIDDENLLENETLLRSLYLRKKAREATEKVQFIFPSSDILLVDCSHTAFFPLTSGVQRVVRNIGKYFKGNQKVWLLRFDGRLAGYARLSEPQIDYLIKPIYKNPTPFDVKMAYLLRCFKMSIPHLWKPAMKTVVHTSGLYYGKFKRLIKNTGIPVSQIVVPWDCSFFMPEVVGVGYRVEYLNRYFRDAGVRLTVLFYDLIPISSPLLCGISDEYPRYLQIMKHCDRITAISHAAKNEIKHLIPVIAGDRKVEIRADHLGFDKKNQTKIVMPDSNLKTILIVGSVDLRKNQLTVVKALEKIVKQANFKLVIVGNKGYYGPEILEEIELIQSSNDIKIEIVLSASEEEVKKYYQECYFTIFCSLSEGFGLPILESLAYGKPCLTSNFGSMMEIGEAVGGCVFVDPLNRQSIADSALKILNDRALYLKLIGSINIESWPTWEEYLEGIYKYSTSYAVSRAADTASLQTSHK